PITGVLQDSFETLQDFSGKPSDINRFGGEWCNGSTTDSDSVCLGSNPSSPARLQFPFADQRLLTRSFSKNRGGPQTWSTTRLEWRPVGTCDGVVIHGFFASDGLRRLPL